MIDTIRAFCLTHELFTPGPVVVAVSGGADSLTLLHILHTLSAEFEITLNVATFDHQIRGDASAADVYFVCSIADSWGIPCFSGSADVPQLAQDWRVGVEAAARRSRYAFLVETAQKIGAEIIATGHNQDDQAETILLHLIRGTGLAGLRGMTPKTTVPGVEAGSDLRLVRPLLETPRTEIDGYLAGLGIQPRHDVTNDDAHYTRNKIRHEVLPLLATINPQVKSALARSAQMIRDDYATLEQTLPPLGTIQRSQFIALQPAQQRLFIRLAAQHILPGVEVSFERTEAARNFALSTSEGKVELGADLWLQLRDDQLLFRNTKLPVPLPYPPDCPALESNLMLDRSGSWVLLGGWSLEISELTGQPAALPVDPLTAVLSVPLQATLELRAPRRGDRVRPYGMDGHSQKLSDLLINLKTPLEWRSQLPVLTVGGEIAWIVLPTRDGPRSRVAESFAVSSALNGDHPLYRFSFRRM